MENETKQYPVYTGIMPDDNITIAGRNEYGYTWDGMLPLTREVALEIYEHLMVFRLYPDEGEAMCDDRAEIENHDGIFGVEVEDWERYLRKKYALRSCDPATESDLFFRHKHMEDDRFAGCCRGYFDRGGRFANTWLYANDELQKIICKDVRKMMTYLIEKGPLKDRPSLLRFCNENAKATLRKNYMYGFTIETEICAYYINFCTTPGDYCVHVYCLVK